MKLETVPTDILSATACHLGEGPSRDAATGLVWWCDILGRALFEADVETLRVTRHRLPRMASEVAAAGPGRQLLAMDDGLYLRTIADGALTLIQPIEAGNRHLRSNDGRVHPCGAFWMGTMSLTFAEGAGSLYWFFRGAFRRLREGLTVPNATCFSPDGRTGYFIDSPTGSLTRIAVDPDTGLPDGEWEEIHRHEGEGVIDGAVTDAEGTLWCAVNGGGAILNIAPDGTLLRRIRIPTSQVTCPCFVGARLDRLLVTTAGEGMTLAEQAADPQHGQTFLLDVGARGRPEPVARPLD